MTLFSKKSMTRLVLTSTILLNFASQKAHANEAESLEQAMAIGKARVETMTPVQKSKYLGVNLLRVVGSCSVSSWTLVGTALAESIPMLSAMTGIGLEMAVNPSISAKEIMAGKSIPPKEFDLFAEKKAHNHVGGGVVSFVVDLVKIAYHFMFDETGEALNEALKMPNTKAGYAALTHLAKRFYGQEGDGECSKSGRAVYDVLNSL